MFRWILMLVIFITLGRSGSVGAQDLPALQLPSDAKFFVQINVEAFRKSSIGKQVYGSIHEKILSELKKEGGDANGFDIQKITEAIGFDPYQEIRTITLASSDFERPENSLIGVVQLGKTTGNLEGLLLAIPGYSSEEFGKHTIHSASMGGGEGKSKDSPQVFGTIYTNAQQQKSVIIGSSKKNVESLLNQFDGKLASDAKTSVAGDSSAFLNVSLLDIPRDKIGNGPQANLAKIVQRVNFAAKEDGDKISLSLGFGAQNEKQAKQIQQMMLGLVALASFIETLDPDDEDLKMVQEWVQGVQTRRNGSSVIIDVKVDSKELAKLIQSSLDDE